MVLPILFMVVFAICLAYQFGYDNGWSKGWDRARDIYEPDLKRWHDRAIEYREALFKLRTKNE